MSVKGDMIKKDYKELMLLYENNEEKTFQELKKIYKNICDIRVIK